MTPLLNRRAALCSLLAPALTLQACSSAAPDPAPSRALRLATGAAGGGFVDFSKAMATVFDGAWRLELRESSGTLQNMRWLEAGECDLMLAVMGVVHDAMNSGPAWGGPPPRRLRALAPMYETSFHLVVRAESPWQSLSQLAGRRIGAGPRGGTAELFLRGLQEGLGLPAERVLASPNDNADQLVRGEIDAFWFGAGLPVPAFVRAAGSAPLRVLGLTPPEVQALRQRFPFFTPFSIPAGTYAGQDRALQTAAVWNFVLSRDDLPDAIARGVVQRLLAGRETMASAYPAADGVRALNAAGNTFLPFHPAAAQLLRAAGARIPTNLG